MYEIPKFFLEYFAFVGPVGRSFFLIFLLSHTTISLLSFARSPLAEIRVRNLLRGTDYQCSINAFDYGYKFFNAIFFRGRVHFLLVTTSTSILSSFFTLLVIIPAFPQTTPVFLPPEYNAFNNCITSLTRSPVGSFVNLDTRLIFYYYAFFYFILFFPFFANILSDMCCTVFTKSILRNARKVETTPGICLLMFVCIIGTWVVFVLMMQIILFFGLILWSFASSALIYITDFPLYKELSEVTHSFAPLAIWRDFFISFVEFDIYLQIFNYFYQTAVLGKPLAQVVEYKVCNIVWIGFHPAFIVMAFQLSAFAPAIFVLILILFSSFVYIVRLYRRLFFIPFVADWVSIKDKPFRALHIFWGLFEITLFLILLSSVCMLMRALEILSRVVS